jgi:hypothetical protein
MRTNYRTDGCQLTMGMAARAGRAVLPWCCVLLVSTLLMLCAKVAFARRAATQSASMPAAITPTETGATWVLLSVAGAQGEMTWTTCLAPPHRFSADVISFAQLADLDDAVADLRCGDKHTSPPVQFLMTTQGPATICRSWSCA